MASTSAGRRMPSVSQLRPTAIDVGLQLGADRLVERRLLVLLQRALPYDLRARGGVEAAVALPALEVLRRGQQRTVEALAEALQRVRGAEEVPAGPDLLVGAEGEARLVDLQRRELVLELAQDLDVDDELLIAGDQARLEPAGGVHHVVRPGQEGREHGHEGLVGGLRVDRLARVQPAARAPRQPEGARDLPGAEQADGRLR